MKVPTRCLGLVAGAAIILASGASLAQKSGGVLKMQLMDTPPSASIHEEGTVSAVVPFMGLYNNLWTGGTVYFDNVGHTWTTKDNAFDNCDVGWDDNAFTVGSNNAYINSTQLQPTNATDLVLSGAAVNGPSAVHATSLSWIDAHTVKFNLSGQLNLPGEVDLKIAMYRDLMEECFPPTRARRASRAGLLP